MVSPGMDGYRTISLEIFRSVQIPGQESQVVMLAGISIALSLGALAFSEPLARMYSPQGQPRLAPIRPAFRRGHMIQFDFSVRRNSFHMQVKVETDARVTGLFGRSGSGKTTVLEAVAGILRPERGSVRLAGRVDYDGALRIDLPPEQRPVAMVFQENRLFPHLDVKENLLFGQRRLPPARRHIGFDEVADLLDLGPLLERRIDQI